jgi:glycosyltransferase involved in cell wall biosynthesis
MNKRIRVGIFNNIGPLYIEPLWNTLLRSEEIEYIFITSAKGSQGIRTIDPETFFAKNNAPRSAWRFVKNNYIGKVLFYQPGVISEVLKNDLDVYIFSGEMYTLSTWIAALIVKINRKPVFFWGHGYYGNEGRLKKYLRLLFYKIPAYHFLYGNRARQLMIGFGFDPEKMFTVYNSLDYETQKEIYRQTNPQQLEELKEKLLPGRSAYPTALFIGRLTKQKKINLLITALHLLKNKGTEFNCILIGNGEEKENLQEIVNGYELNNSVCFYGASYDETETSALIMLSDCCVSPGNAGLTAIHSMAFGTPVITHSEFSHQGPEAESVLEGKTGFLFKEDDIESLLAAMHHFVDKNQKKRMEKDCIAMVETYYNPQNQADIITSVVLEAVCN